MENRIKLLPEIVANQIAAGEVVDNPSSVVKEMMENAIDAGAKSVKVNFRNAGLELIQIIDDGCGMSPMDARLAFDRHATSKISEFDDIYRLHTFGFRGEALASIAAVAEVELRTRKAEDEVGSLTVVNGGEFVSQTPTMCPAGSQFMVRNLFYTAPARRKFSKDRTKMVGDIKREFRRVALCNEGVSFELMSNDMSVMKLPAASLLERIIDVVGRHIKSNLLEVNIDTSIVKIKGYIGRPQAAKQKNTEQYLFVNGRYFRSPQIYHSIMRAYDHLMVDGVTPSYFLYLTVEPDRVDVNVSPHKTEVRFADNEDINQMLTASLRSTLAKCGGVSLMDFDNEMAIDIPPMGQGETLYSEPKSSSKSNYNPFEEMAEPSMGEVDFDMSAYDVPYSGVSDVQSAAARKSAGGGGAASLRDIPWGAFSSQSDFALENSDGGQYREVCSSAVSGGKSELEYREVAASEQSLIEAEEMASVEQVMLLAGGYAIARCGVRVLLVDLRRAKERVIYDSTYDGVCRGRGVSQQLLFPESVTLAKEDYALLKDNLEEFLSLGFDMELLGEESVELRGVPSMSVGESADSLLYDLLKEVEATGSAEGAIRERMLKAMARRGAARMVGCTQEQAKAVVEQLLATQNYSFSPSGKAIMAEITADFIKSKLG